MEGRKKLLEILNLIPKKLKDEFIYEFADHNLTLNEVQYEVFKEGRMGDDIVNKLGYGDD